MKYINNCMRGLGMGNGGLGIGDWGLGPIPNPQFPIPNPQFPIPKNNAFKNNFQKNISVKIKL